ncbi:MAG TPA: hypothetical protein VF904_02530, partial [Anaeromyxobacteraceae bacterium]
PNAGIDPEKTSVYILDDATQPLIVDTDGDGFCDHINPHLIPTTQPPTSTPTPTPTPTPFAGVTLLHA